jgi:hypothetical protein
MYRPYLLILMALLLVSACSDDDPVVPPEFKVTIEVTDPQGDPVEGLDLSLTMDLEFLQDKQDPPGRPAVAIPFELDQETIVRLSIDDITGSEVRLLGEQVFPAGSHTWVWNGLDDKGGRLSSGVYHAHLVVHDVETEQELLDETKVMFMAIIDPGRFSAGTTDADGKIELTDERLFPALFEVEDIPAVNENAEIMGTIEITPTTRFFLADLVNGGGHRFYEDITGSTTIEVTWDPAKTGQNHAARTMQPADKADVDPVPMQNRLRQPYPVPFN